MEQEGRKRMCPKYPRFGNRHLRCCMGERESIFFTFMRELQHIRMEQFPTVALLASLSLEGKCIQRLSGQAHWLII